MGYAATLLIAYMQQRRLTRIAVERLGFSSSLGGFGRVVSKQQHYRVAGPTRLVDYLLEDTGEVGGSLLGTLRARGYRSVAEMAKFFKSPK